jgi:hypothetical protein
MINIQELSYKHKIYLVSLVRKISPELNVSPDTLNSLKPGVIQFCFNNWTARPLKKKIIESIINKIPNPQVVDGEFYVIPEQLELELK